MMRIACECSSSQRLHGLVLRRREHDEGPSVLGSSLPVDGSHDLAARPLRKAGVIEDELAQRIGLLGTQPVGSCPQPAQRRGHVDNPRLRGMLCYDCVRMLCYVIEGAHFLEV